MSRIAPFSAQMTAMIVYFAAAALFYLASRPREAHAPHYAHKVFWLVLLIGTFARVTLAAQTPGNYDRESWQMVADIFSKGGNVYAETGRYNYSPVWFWVLGMLHHVSTWVAIPFALIVRLFLTCVDVATALLLGTWPKISPWERARQAMFFYLNPVSFLLTGVHGPFDDLSIFFLVLALWISAQPVREEMRAGWVWALTTFALLVKQIVLIQLVIVVLHFFKKKKALLMLGISLGIFLLSFAPYWHEGKEGILQNVFYYRSYTMPYGFAVFGDLPIVSSLFIVLLFVYPLLLVDRRLTTKLLCGMLFFLTFTTGFGVQYLVLPIVYGAMRPSRGFYIYSLTAGAFLLGSYFNMGILYFAWIPLWGVWATAVYWWFTIHPKVAKAL